MIGIQLTFLIIIVFIFYLVYKLNYNWKLYHLSSLIFLGIFIILNLVIVPLFPNTEFATNLFLISIGPGLLIINLINSYFSSTVSFTIKFILMFLYSAVMWFLFGYILGWVYFILNKKKKKSLDLKKKKSLKKKLLKKKNNTGKRSKGQISLETIALTSIMVISAIIVGVVYFNYLNSENSDNVNLDSTISNIEDKLSDSFGSTSTIKIITGCDLNFHCFNSVLDCEEETIRYENNNYTACGGRGCVLCDVTILDVNFDPPTLETTAFEDFDIISEIDCFWEPCTCSWEENGDVLSNDCDSVSLYYTSPGVKNVNLIVDDSYGFLDSNLFSFDLPQHPDYFTTFLYYPTSINYITSGEDINFSGNSDCVNPVVYTWTSNFDGILGYGDNISVSDLSIGLHRITLNAYDTVAQKSFLDKITNVHVLDGPTDFFTTITLPSDSFFVLGDAVLFRGDSGDNSRYRNIQFTWYSDVNGFLDQKVNSFYHSFSIDDLNAGVHNITLESINLPTGETHVATTQIEIIVPEDFNTIIDNPSIGATFTLGEQISFLSHESCPREVSFVWNSSIDGDISFQEDFNISSLSLGTHVVTIIVTDILTRVISQDEIIIEIVDYPTPYDVTIYSPGNNYIYFLGDTVDFRSIINSRDSTKYMWTSDQDHILSDSKNFQTNKLSRGTHLITLSAINLLTSEYSQDQITLDIMNNIKLFIDEPVDNLIYPENSVISFSSHIDGILNLDYLWTSSIDGVLSTGNNFSISDLNIGIHNINLVAYNDETNVFLRKDIKLEIIDSQDLSFLVNNDSANSDYFKISKLPNSVVYINWNNNLTTQVPIQTNEDVVYKFSDYLELGDQLQNVSIYPASNITSFVTNSNRISEDIAIFNSCDNLEELNLNLANFSGNIAFLNTGDIINILDLGYNLNIDGALEFLTFDTSLEYLDLNSTNVSGNIDALYNFRLLNNLNLSNCTNINYSYNRKLHFGEDIESGKGGFIDFSNMNLSTIEIDGLLTAFNNSNCAIYTLKITGNALYSNQSVYDSLISKGWVVIN